MVLIRVAGLRGQIRSRRGEVRELTSHLHPRPRPRLEHGASAPSVRSTLLQSPCIRYPSPLLILAFLAPAVDTRSLGSILSRASSHRLETSSSQLALSRQLPASTPAPAPPRTRRALRVSDVIHSGSSIYRAPTRRSIPYISRISRRSARCAATGSPCRPSSETPLVQESRRLPYIALTPHSRLPTGSSQAPYPIATAWPFSFLHPKARIANTRPGCSKATLTPMQRQLRSQACAVRFKHVGLCARLWTAKQ